MVVSCWRGRGDEVKVVRGGRRCRCSGGGRRLLSIRGWGVLGIDRRGPSLWSLSWLPLWLAVVVVALVVPLLFSLVVVGGVRSRFC